MVLQRKYLFKVSYFQINALFRYYSLNALSSQLQLAMSNWCWLDRRKFCLILLCSLWPNTSKVNVCRWYSENSLLYNQLSYALYYLHVSVLSWWNLKMYILYKGQMDLRCSTISNIYDGHHCESIWLTWTCFEICFEKYLAKSHAISPFAWLPIEMTGIFLQNIFLKRWYCNSMYNILIA